MKIIDIEYDYRLDSKCGDPDTDSPKLYEIHSLLWNKEISKNITLNLSILSKSYGRLILKNNLTDNLSSDRMCPHYVGKYNGKLDKWLSETEKEKFQQKVRTIGGHIVFPAHRKDGFTINQARGVNRKICDRFDLTLECFRRFYINEESPLTSTLKRYSDFLKLFRNFKGYTDFFMLQDFIENSGKIKFLLPFDNFNRSALPESKEEYVNYMNSTIELIDKRNERILNRMKKACVQHHI
ncbi:hypothetical protein KO506_10365 [Polaribacter vadi]|uniref:DUF6994 family protein n=1 Tax=Polaribacter TaxID=52959 RepID=UPI001C097C14|nr:MULTISPECIES: hypothetical protein [Polaribacter]MBU3011808.1 hypothetical protein [Polaribacter vadi]MDO6741621.1 hypothetical protein [Polaribacter sp. 1_MG-2023]